MKDAPAIITPTGPTIRDATFPNSFLSAFLDHLSCLVPISGPMEKIKSRPIAVAAHLPTLFQSISYA